jgi:tripartite ATP-independent transporter DctM subunit
MVIILIIVVMMLFLAAGMEIAVAFGVIASLGFVLLIDHPQVEIAWAAWLTNNSFTLMAMPLFVFMGTIFANTGIIRGLFRAADRWVGVLPGGLASSVILSGAVFGAMSGSSIAAAATFSTISMPEMERRGYDPKLALGAIAIGGTLSVLIPPSIILIIYGTWINVSIAQLFAAAIIPGIILSLLLIATVTLMVLVKPEKAPKVPSVSWKEKVRSIIDVLPWIGLIIVVLGVIFLGIMTPTEASALGAFLSVLFALAYRQMTFEALKDSLFSAVKVASMIGFVLFTARLIAFLLQDLGATEVIASFVLGLPIGKYGTIGVIFFMYLILGMFFDAVSMLVLTVPFVYPVLMGLGFNPVWLGVAYVILAEISFVTPPFGLNLFAIHGVNPKYPILTIAAGVLPFIIPTLIMLVILIAFPQLALWLPKVLY